MLGNVTCMDAGLDLHGVRAGRVDELTQPQSKVPGSSKRLNLVYSKVTPGESINDLLRVWLHFSGTLLPNISGTGKVSFRGRAACSDEASSSAAWFPLFSMSQSPVHACCFHIPCLVIVHQSLSQATSELQRA